MQPLAFVDLETTGCTAPLDRITEIGIVEVDDDGVREWSTLINPETSIPGSIQSMTGITNEMVQDAPTFEDVAKQTMERLKGRLFIEELVSPRWLRIQADRTLYRQAFSGTVSRTSTSQS